MLQRIQTVWLLLAMGCSVALLYFPVWQVDAAISEGMNSIGANTHAYLLAFPPILFLTHAASIFSFRNRKRQLKFCGFSIVLLVIFLAASLVLIQVENDLLANFHPGDFQWGAMLPVIAILFNLMARKGIRKDEELIRSMDRLR
jgi:hypothetical protein